MTNTLPKAEDKLDTFEVTGRTPSGTESKWTGVLEKDLGWFKDYLGETYVAFPEYKS